MHGPDNSDAAMQHSSTQSSSELDDVSAKLVHARQQAHALSEFPGQLPSTLEEAYAIQRTSIARWADPVAGWKIGMLAPADQTRFSTERLCGPIFSASVHRIESGGRHSMPIFVGGFAAAEAEFVIELGVNKLPSKQRLSDTELIDLVSALYVGVEIASSPMAAINKLGPTCVVSDFGNNAGLLLGPQVPGWHSRPMDSLTSQVSVDGAVVGSASAAAIPGGPLQAFRFLVELFSAQNQELPAGTLVSTGASTGIHDVLVTSTVFADFGEFGAFDVLFEPMQPMQSAP